MEKVLRLVTGLESALRFLGYLDGGYSERAADEPFRRERKEKKVEMVRVD